MPLGSPVVPDVNASKATSSRPVRTASNFTDLLERGAVEFRIVVGGAVEIDDLLEEGAALGTCDQFVGDAGIGERQTDLGLIDDLGEFAGTQHRHGVDGHGATLGDRQPGRDHGGVVARPDEHAMAWSHAEVLGESVGEAVRPVGKLLVGASAAVADQRGSVAEALLDHAIGELDGGVQILRVLEFGSIENQIGPLLRRGKLSRVKVSTWALGPSAADPSGPNDVGCGWTTAHEKTTWRTLENS